MSQEEKDYTRDLCIEGAIFTLIKLIEPTISAADIQRRGSMDVLTGCCTVALDGDPVAFVRLDSGKSFSFTILRS